MSDWGKGVNNNIGWGQGADNNIGWGSIYDKSNAGETLLLRDNTAFIIEVDTTKAGTPSNQFQFTGAEGDYYVVAKQNDIVVATFNDLSGQQTITLPSSGVYDLEIKAKEVNGFDRIRFSGGGDKDKMLDVKQLGNIVWSSFEAAFRDTNNMAFTATDSPNLSVCNSFRNAFRSSKANPDVRNWDVSNITDMIRMFNASSANPDVRNWDVSNVTDMFAIFESSNLSVENLTAIYENWSQLIVEQNVRFSAGTTKYNASGQEGRDILVNTYNWIIEDGGQV